MIPFEKIYLPLKLQQEIGHNPSPKDIWNKIVGRTMSLYAFNFSTYNDELCTQVQCGAKIRSINDLYNIFRTILGEEFSLKEFLDNYFEYFRKVYYPKWPDQYLLLMYCGDMGRSRIILKDSDKWSLASLKQYLLGYDYYSRGTPSWGEILEECYNISTVDETCQFIADLNTFEPAINKPTEALPF